MCPVGLASWFCGEEGVARRGENNQSIEYVEWDLINGNYRTRRRAIYSAPALQQ